MGALRGFETVRRTIDVLKIARDILPQVRTNGLAKLGTLLAPVLPLFLTNNPLPHGYPWSSLDDVSTNPYTQYPDTGVIRSYDFTISRGRIAPDGYEREVLLVNGAFPGPTIEANWGDSIQVTVHNNITGPEEGTAIHWHGFLQNGTPWEDGSPALTQCPITPGLSYTYQFKATLFGTSWYHSHFSAQYSGGVLGPIVVYGPSQQKYDIDVGPVMVSDWHHKSYETIIEELLSPGAGPIVPSENTLIQGKNNFSCSSVVAGDTAPCTNNAPLSVFQFQKNKVHRLRLINSGSQAVIRFSIDNHVMTVIANDFVPIEPYDTTVVTVGVGQRADILVRANATVNIKNAAFWIRAMQTSCSEGENPLALAKLYYNGADTNMEPTTSAWNNPDPGTCTNDDLSLTVPKKVMALPAAQVTYPMNTSRVVNASNIALWTFDGVSFRGNYNSPPLLLANQGNFSYPTEWNVRNFGTNSTIRIVVNNPTPAPHPMHLHGYDFYILHEGDGAWDGTIVRPENPMRRDVALLRGKGHLVIQFDANNPGIWGFHCHLAWHASGGFFSSFVINPPAIQAMRIPLKVAQTCRDWADWTKTHIPDQIDSGL